MFLFHSYALFDVIAMKLLPFSLILAVAAAQEAVVVASPVPPSSCLALPGDASWPATSVWRQAMPEVEKPKQKGAFKHPDYRLEATTTGEVVAAVKFAKEHNIRLTVLNSG
jgi:hypothetical protein